MEADEFVFDLSDQVPTAFGGTIGPGDVEDHAGLPGRPHQRHRHGRPARGGRGRRRLGAGRRDVERAGRHRRRDGGAGGADQPRPPPGAGAAAPAAGAGCSWPPSSARPPSCSLRSSSTRSWPRWSGASTTLRATPSSASTTTGRCSRATGRSRPSGTTPSGWSVAPTLATAIGLIFAVLAERVRWETAFKVAVFMPMAISGLATGVIFRIVYDANPELGVAERRHRACVADAVQGGGRVRRGPAVDAEVLGARGRRLPHHRHGGAGPDGRPRPRRHPPGQRPGRGRAGAGGRERGARRRRRHRVPRLHAGRWRGAGRPRPGRAGPARGGGASRRRGRTGGRQRHHRRRRLVRARGARPRAPTASGSPTARSDRRSTASTGSAPPWSRRR